MTRHIDLRLATLARTFLAPLLLPDRNHADDCGRIRTVRQHARSRQHASPPRRRGEGWVHLPIRTAAACSYLLLTISLILPAIPVFLFSNTYVICDSFKEISRKAKSPQ